MFPLRLPPSFPAQDRDIKDAWIAGRDRVKLPIPFRQRELFPDLVVASYFFRARLHPILFGGVYCCTVTTLYSLFKFLEFLRK